MIGFESTVVTSTFLDPQNDYARKELTIEHRRDPLTGSYSRVADYMSPRAPEEVPDSVREAAIPIFAPPLVHRVTPRFPEVIDGDGRLQRGSSVLFPNLNPYDEYSPVVAIGERTLVEPGDLSATDVADALCLMRDFFARLPEDRRVGLVGWNYLPASSSSIPHPHLQGISSFRPPGRLAAEYAGESAYRGDYGSDYWDDLVAAERDGPRWLGAADGWIRLMAYSSRSAVPESLLVSDGISDMQAASDDDLQGLAAQLVALATAHHAAGFASFNMALHPTAPVPGSRLRARYIPRTYIVPKISSSDQTWLHLGSEEGLCLCLPERFATMLRDHL